MRLLGNYRAATPRHDPHTFCLTQKSNSFTVSNLPRQLIPFTVIHKLSLPRSLDHFGISRIPEHSIVSVRSTSLTMKVLLLAAALLTGLVASQPSIGSLPACAIPCVSSGIAATGCALTDVPPFSHSCIPTSLSLPLLPAVTVHTQIFNSPSKLLLS